MLPLRVAVCEDRDEDARRLIEMAEESGREFTLTRFESGEALLASFAKGAFDVLFIDIRMGGMTGIDTLGEVRKADAQIVVAFTTASRDFALESYHLNAYKYLLKPVAAADVAEVLDLAELMRDKRKERCTVLAESGPVTLYLDEIVYADVMGYQTTIHTVDGTVETSIPIGDLCALLCTPRFLRCHRAYLVNLDHVKRVDGDFRMSNGDTVLIRVRDYRKMRKRYEEHLFAKVREQS